MSSSHHQSSNASVRSSVIPDASLSVVLRRLQAVRIHFCIRQFQLRTAGNADVKKGSAKLLKGCESVELLGIVQLGIIWTDAGSIVYLRGCLIILISTENKSNGNLTLDNFYFLKRLIKQIIDEYKQTKI